MSDTENSSLLQVLYNYYVIDESECDNFSSFLQNDTTLIYISEAFEEDNKILNLVENDLVKNIFVITRKHANLKLDKVKFLSRINSKILLELAKNVAIIVKINEHYSNSRYIVKNLIKLFEYEPDIENRFINVETDKKIVCSIVNDNSLYFEDMKNCIKAILIKDKNRRYEFIYDTACDYLDSKFQKCNVCDFKNDQCAANRAHRINHSIMGCCHSFDYAKIYEPGVLKNVKVCQYMQNRRCTTKNISCKLYTCKYVKKRHPDFNFKSRKILLLDCFFNRKQHDIIQYNFFKTREEILQKLQRKNYDMYWWYVYRRKYMVK